MDSYSTIFMTYKIQCGPNAIEKTFLVLLVCRAFFSVKFLGPRRKQHVNVLHVNLIHLIKIMKNLQNGVVITDTVQCMPDPSWALIQMLTNWVYLLHKIKRTYCCSSNLLMVFFTHGAVGEMQYLPSVVSNLCNRIISHFIKLCFTRLA